MLMCSVVTLKSLLIKKGFIDLFLTNQISLNCKY